MFFFSDFIIVAIAATFDWLIEIWLLICSSISAFVPGWYQGRKSFILFYFRGHTILATALEKVIRFSPDQIYTIVSEAVIFRCWYCTSMPVGHVLKLLFTSPNMDNGHITHVELLLAVLLI